MFNAAVVPLLQREMPLAEPFVCRTLRTAGIGESQVADRIGGKLLESVARPRWRHVFLPHLPRDCTSPAAVEAACGSVLAARACGFSVVAPGGGTPLFEF